MEIMCIVRVIKFIAIIEKTDEYSLAYTDLEDGKTSPLNGVMTYISQVADGRMYFSSMEAYTHIYTYGYQDIVTGEVKVLRVCSESESPELSAPCVEDGYIYYICKILRNDGDAKNPDDYLPYVCRMPADGGDEETVCELEDNYELLKFVIDGKLITYFDGVFYSINIETKERIVIFDIVKEGYRSYSGYMSCLNGKIYFICQSDSYVESEYKKSRHQLSFLLCIDMKTGDVKKVIEEPVISFCLTDDTIYYSLFELRHLYIPEDYKEHPENVVIFLTSPDLHACDLDGSNDRVIYTNEEINFATSYTIIDEVLYGFLWDYNENLHKFGDTYFGKIDFSTGKVTAAVKAK